MTDLFKILLVTACISYYIFPQVIDEINVSGNSYFTSNNIVEWSGLKTGTEFKPYHKDSSKFLISKNLAQRGYFNSDSQLLTSYSDDSQKVKIIIRLNEGKPSYIRKFQLTGTDSLKINLFPDFSYLEGRIFNRIEIEEYINQWLVMMENKGYPFANASIISVELNDSDDVSYTDIKLLLNEGIKSKISRIEIQGNTSTKDYVITRELRLSSDQLYSQKLIEEFPGRLNRLRFFEPVPLPEFYLDDNNNGVLVINVKDRQTNTFDGIIGYIPGVNQQKGYVTGLVNIGMRNLFGTGRAASVHWQQYDRLSQEMELDYLEPWILGYPFNISAGFYQRKQDSSWVQRRIEGMVEFLATEDITAGVTLNSERVIPAVSDVPRFTVYSSNSVTTGINLKIDTRDDPYAPTTGLLLFNSYSFSRKKIYGPAQFITPATETNLNLQRIAVDFSIFRQIFSRQIVALGIHGRELRGSFFEESDLFYLGGAYTLRGYREKQYAGSRIFWSNTEYRLLLTRRTYAFLFFDSGYYLRKEDPDRNILKTEAFKTGYGAGLNIETGIGVLVVSYALATGDNFSNGKIHFGILNEF